MEKLNDKWFRIVGIPLVAAISQIVFFPSMVIYGRYSLFKVFGVAILIALIIWEGNRQGLIAVRRYFPGLKNTGKRLLVLFFCLAIITAILSSIIVYISGAIRLWGYPTVWRHYMVNFFVRFSLAILLAAIYEGIYFYDQWQKSYQEGLSLKRQKTQYAVDGLIAQVNPQFFFQSLNSLSSLIVENKKLAVSFVDELSQVYRYVLQQTDSHWVSLEAELQFVKAYLSILKLRFEEGLIFQENIKDEDKQLQIQPLALKILIDDAIAHNKISTAHPLSISASVNAQHQLVLQYPLQYKTLLVKPERDGLTNLATKVQLLTNQPLFIEETNGMFLVKMPLVQPAEQA